MAEAKVEIEQTGMGGSILYREDGNVVRFGWEFAASPTLVLVFGSPARNWDESYPWARGRQTEIYDAVSAEIVRQQAPGSACKIDLEDGTIAVMEASAARQTAVQPAAQAAVDAAQNDHLSVDTRLAAAEVTHRQGRLADFDSVLAREIRALDRPADGLSRALRLAAANPSKTVLQALLWASWNQTECAPACAGLLLTLTDGGRAPLEAENLQQIVARLGPHSNVFDRQAGFEALCRRTSMTLDAGE